MSEKVAEVKPLKLFLRTTCPKCGSTQFSIGLFENFRPPDADPDVIGVSDCRSCQADFYVAMSPEFQRLLPKPTMDEFVYYISNLSDGEKKQIIVALQLSLS